MFRHAEFQAVILAGGKGSRMMEITTEKEELVGEKLEIKQKPKCLLPIGNMPMIWYPLQLLKRAGFSEVIVVVPDSNKNDIATTLDKLNLNLKLEFIGIPGNEDLGTADSMRLIHEKIHSDFVVVSCDLITDIDLIEVLNVYRRNNASITALMHPIPKIPDDLVTPGPKNKQRPETDLIGIDNATGRLVFLASASDFEETINMPRKLLKKHTDFTVHSKLLDAHLYVIKKWVLDFLVHNKNFSTLKGELLPHIVKKQLERPQKEIDDKNTSVVKVDLRDDIFRFAVAEDYSELIQRMSAFNDHSNDLKEAYHGDVIRCYAHVMSGKCGLRANTIQMYNLANSMINEWWDETDKKNTDAKSPSSRIASTATVKSTQVENCRIDENAVIHEKTSIKHSHIGYNVTVEPKTRILNSVIMGNVTIRQRCIVDNCILCNGCVIEEGTELKDCIVGIDYVVATGSRHSREVLTGLDRMMVVD